MAHQSITKAGVLPDVMTDLIIFGPNGGVIEFATATNDSALDVIVSFEIVMDGGTAKHPKDKTITPEDKVISIIPGKLYGKEGDKIRGMSSAADSSSYLISGVGDFFP